MRTLTMDELSLVSGGFDEDGWGSGPSHWLLPDPLKEHTWDIINGPFSGASGVQKLLASKGAGFGGEFVLVTASKNSIHAAAANGLINWWDGLSDSSRGQILGGALVAVGGGLVLAATLTPTGALVWGVMAISTAQYAGYGLVTIGGLTAIAGMLADVGAGR